MDVQPEVTFVDDHGNVLAPPGIPAGAASTDPSISQDETTTAGRRIALPIPEGATRVVIFLPRDS